MISLRRFLGRIKRRVRAGRAKPAVRPSLPRLQPQWTYPSGDGELRIAVFKELLGLFPAGRMLDLACGHGLFAIAAHEMGWHVTAVDVRTERMPMTPGVDWVQHDVRTYQVDGFDVIALLGLLYHLELPDQLDLLRRCSRTITILDTHHSNRPTHLEEGYAGHTYRELPEGQEERLAVTQTAAWGNLTSFWPTQPDLVRMLRDSGFATILALVPPNTPDRTFYLCLPERNGHDSGHRTPPAPEDAHRS